jgi:hypothetical protein
MEDAREGSVHPRARAALEAVAPSLTISGLVLFLILRIYYNRFYGALGIDPSSLGLSYGNTLATSLGLMVWLLVAALVFPVALSGSIYVAIRLLSYEPASFASLARRGVSDLRRWLPKASRTIFPIATFLALIVCATYLWHKADVYAEAVREGRPIKFGNLFVASFNVRATPVDLAKVESPNAPEHLPTSLPLRVADVLYLGRADGRLVLYDFVRQEVVYLDDKIFLVKLANCELKRPSEPRCEKAVH